MTPRAAALASALFALAGPGLEAGVGPFLLTRGYRAGDPSAVGIAVGAVGIAVGLAVVAWCFVGFVRDGTGTPSPLAPPARLVVRGPYRWVRHPMYVATALVIAGEGLVLARPVLLAAAAFYLATLATQARVLEEPRLAARFGAEFSAYRAAVPGWIPRRPARA